VIEGGDLSGDAQRMVQRKKLDGGADPKTIGPGTIQLATRRGADSTERAGFDQHLRQPHDVEPPRFPASASSRRSEPLVLGASAPYLLREDSEVHGASLLRRRRGGVDRQIPALRQELGVVALPCPSPSGSARRENFAEVHDLDVLRARSKPSL